MSPDGSKVAITDEWTSQTCIVEITSGSGTDITDPIEVIENVYALAWFPDSKRIAYLRGWKDTFSYEFWDLVVRRPASSQCATIYRSYGYSEGGRRILITADGSRLVTQDPESFRTWDVSDL